MFKRILVLFAALLAFSLSAFGADANTASQAELEAIKGIGPVISGKIIEERNKAPFKDWPDLVTRVKGIGDTSAGKLSTAGLTVNGTPYSAATAAKPAAAATPATKMTPATAATPATPAAPANPAKPATSAKMSTPATPATAATVAAASEPASASKSSRKSKKASAASAAASK
jgi:competence protein ComEA